MRGVPMSKISSVFRNLYAFIASISKAEASPDLSLQDAVRLCSHTGATDRVAEKPTRRGRKPDARKSAYSGIGSGLKSHG
jgi:hypothetical protein